MKGHALFQGEIKTKNQKYIEEILKNLRLQNHSAYFNRTFHKALLDVGDSSLYKWRATSFSKGRYQRNSIEHIDNICQFQPNLTQVILG